MNDWDEINREEWSFTFFLKGLKTLWELLGDERKNICRVIGWLIFLSVLDLLLPYFLKLIFDEIPVVLIQKQISRYLIWLVVSIFLLRIFTLYLRHFSKEIRFLKSLIKLENFWPVMAQEKLLALSIGYHERENTGKKIAKINKGCEKLVDIVVNLFWDFLPSFFYLAINIVFILVIDWKLGVLFIIPFIPAAIINLKIHQRFASDWEKWEEKKEISSGLFCQSLINVKTVQSFVQEEREKTNLSFVRKQMENLDINVSTRMQNYFFAMNLILQASFILIIFAGIYFVYKGQSTVGTVVYILITGNVTIQSLWGLIHVYMKIMRNLVAVIRMKELIDQEIDIKNSPNAIVPREFNGNFEFRDVTFNYPDKSPVLKNLNFEIKPNQMTALVGKSGEGKTTIIRLICRMYDVSSGGVLLDGRDIRDLDLSWYRRLFAIVQQDVDIFDSTIFDNIKYSCPNASLGQVEEAIRAAYLENILNDKERFPDGLSTQVGERGVRLSGGEQQRVGIARAYLALLNGAKMLILDEATSDLDSEAERAIQVMIGRLRNEMAISIIAIAHRLSTIKKSDVIFVIGEGGVVEKGAHDELLSKKGLYSELVEFQTL